MQQKPTQEEAAGRLMVIREGRIYFSRKTERKVCFYATLLFLTATLCMKWNIF